MCGGVVLVYSNTSLLFYHIWIYVVLVARGARYAKLPTKATGKQVARNVFEEVVLLMAQKSG